MQSFGKIMSLMSIMHKTIHKQKRRTEPCGIQNHDFYDYFPEALMIMLEFCPPNPRELDMAQRTLAFLAWLGT